MASEAAISNPLLTSLQQPPPPPPLMAHHQQRQAAEAEEAAAAPPPAKKKKRNLPGTPDPDAEVISLSPRTLLATNRFVCEICGKGFQRDQNLQLHRRGHNLPWKLRQRAAGKEARKRVYVCPEKSCVHHNPARALGDLTGIKKHFCRKHGEKKWKCEKCSKKYAVQSDWKAHTKTCGTREYRCDCGTIFSRRDSFITHRAFCDALAEETARLNNNNNTMPPAAAAYHHHQQQQLPLLPPSSSSSISMGGMGGISQLMYAADAQLGISSWLYAAKPSVFSGQQDAKADMSATALLHRAAQMGAVTSAADACMFAGHQYQHQQDAAVVGRERDLGVGDDTTRDFLGVAGVQTLCSTTTSLPLLHGWI
ncbi:unnamed protein product [Urochloa humidicola]